MLIVHAVPWEWKVVKIEGDP